MWGRVFLSYGGWWQVHMGGDSYNGKQRGDIFRLKQLSYCKFFFSRKSNFNGLFQRKIVFTTLVLKGHM